MIYQQQRAEFSRKRIPPVPFGKYALTFIEQIVNLVEFTN